MSNTILKPGMKIRVKMRELKKVCNQHITDSDWIEDMYDEFKKMKGSHRNLYLTINSVPNPSPYTGKQFKGEGKYVFVDPPGWVIPERTFEVM